MRLIAYVRVSTEEQAEKGHSLSLQPDMLRAWCERSGHELVGVIGDEGVSAGTALRKRIGGRLLLDRLASGEADGVVALRPDRLFRNARDGLWFIEEFCIEHGTALLLMEGGSDTSTPSGWLTLAIQLVTAQYARLIDAQRGREVNAALRQQGRVYGGVPFGCMEREGKLYRVHGSWGVREHIVALREGVAGAGFKPDERGPLSLAQISARLFEERIASPGGAKRWSKSTLKNVLDTHEQFVSLPWLAPGENDTATPTPTA